ncbi:SHOCT domain-containing protein [Lacticaseibacillus hulanensis]|uniref:SHOCT domain-containing protein n=1 Tax=Lacticaseibacillus hulanensis TaxID=2493111 RepID=UPI000FD8C1E1|nr:SHOCT domain-containing protein [Lacticaseibacillus hulanensis]
MARYCAYDNEKIGMMVGSVTLADGSVLCNKHWDRLGFSGFTGAYSSLLNKHDVAKIIDEGLDGDRYVASLSGFDTTFEYDKQASIGNYIHVSPTTKQIQIGGAGLFKFKPQVQVGYKNIVSYHVVEDGDQIIAKSGVGRAIGGGLLFGPVGAIVGGVTGKKKSKKIVTDLHIDVVVSDRPKNSYTISIISTQTKPGLVLTNARTTAAQISAFIDNILALQEQESTDTVSVAQNETANEIRQFKSLLDDGIITEEEFNAKKKELLGL